MPLGDGTGPNGEGPRTGRGLGFCSGYNSPGYTKGIPMGGRGFGRGFGRGGFARGRGFAWRAFPTAYPRYSEDDEKAYLEDELTALRDEMKAIEDRLKELKPKKK